MESTVQEGNEFREFLGVVARRKTQGFVAALIILIIATGLALFLPAVYRSQAIILIEQQEIPSDFVRSTVTSFADQRIQVISQRVMTSGNLTQIIDKYDLYADERERDPLEVILAEMREDIRMEMISADVVDPTSGRAREATIAFSLAYENESPALAQRVANEVVTLFLNENLRSRTEMAEETSSFLNEEANKLEAQVNDLEQKLADFKKANVERLPELLDRNYNVLDRTEQELASVRAEIGSLKERRIYLESQLAQVPPYESAYGEDGRRVLTPTDRLRQLETELVAAKARYGASHPDVKRLQNEVNALQTETGAVPDVAMYITLIEEVASELNVLREKYSEEHPEVAQKRRELEGLRMDLAVAEAAAASGSTEIAENPNNPAYIQLKAQLEGTRSELESAYERRADLEAKITDFESRLADSAGVERQYRSLLRQYETALAKFQEFSAKRVEADVSESLEREQKGERFTLIEPPMLPEEPAKPNRWAIFLIGVVLSLGGGAGTVSVAEALDDKVRGRRGVLRLAGQAPIGVIPPLDARGRVQRQSSGLGKILITLAVLIAVGLTAVHLLFMPLDVLWFAVLRKLGIWSV